MSYPCPVLGNRRYVDEIKNTNEKLLFLHHLTTLPEDSLAAEVLKVQDRLKLPGLAEECKEFLVRFRIPNVASYSKIQWKQFVKRQIWQMNKEEILEKMKTYKKIEYQKFENRRFEPQPYLKLMSPANVRLRFTIWAKMTPTVRMNFRNNREYRDSGWTCPDCQSLDTQEHVVAAQPSPA